MDVAEFVSRFPRLWHMAADGAWPSIQSRGLLSTSALLDLFEVPVSKREPLETQRRHESVTIRHPEHGLAVIRDQKPIIESVLERTLDGMTPADWYRTLNNRVFFWLSTHRLNRMREAPPYRNDRQTILVIDTHQLLTRHVDRVTLSPYNSGATHPGAKVRRGPQTFAPFTNYDWNLHRRRNAAEPVAELAVGHSVPDIADCVLDVVVSQPTP